MDLAGMLVEVLRWATDAPVEVADTGGGSDWTPAVWVSMSVGAVSALLAGIALVFAWRSMRASEKSADSSRDAVKVASRQTELQSKAAEATIAESQRATEVAIRQTDLQAETARESIAQSKRSIEVAIEQTELQRAIAEESRAAVVWADVRPHPDSPDFLYLSVGNSGLSVAREVRVRIDPPIKGTSDAPERAKEVQDAARSGIASLVPGRTYEWRLGLAREIIQANLDQSGIRLTITWEDERGCTYGDTFPIRVSDVWMTAIVTRGSLKDVANAIKRMK